MLSLLMKMNKMQGNSYMFLQIYISETEIKHDLLLFCRDSFIYFCRNFFHFSLIVIVHIVYVNSICKHLVIRLHITSSTRYVKHFTGQLPKKWKSWPVLSWMIYNKRKKLIFNKRRKHASKSKSKNNLVTHSVAFWRH